MPLKALGISRRFKETWALKDVSFEASEGKVTGIFGPGGSGKSVLLRVLAGVDKQFNGERELGSSDGLATVGNTVSLVGSEPPGAGFSFFFNRASSTRSTADWQLAALDGAKRSGSRVILLDEPFCHLDAEQRRREFAQFRSLAKNTGVAVIFATVSFDDAAEFCDEIVVLHKGEVLQTGTAKQIYLEPDSAVVAGLTGRNNIFEARRLTSSKVDVPEFQSIAGSHRIYVRSHPRGKLGALNANVQLAIRPEHISISFGASFPEDNLLKAKITGIRFLGANTLVELDASGLRIDALVMRLVGLNRGDECMLGMPPDRIRIYA